MEVVLNYRNETTRLVRLQTAPHRAGAAAPREDHVTAPYFLIR